METQKIPAPEDATLIVLFLMTVGCPLSYHKLDFGNEILWFGLKANFQTSSWRPPDEKYEKMKGILRHLMDWKGVLERKSFDAGIGLIQ